MSINAELSYTIANNFMESISFKSAIEAYDNAIKEDSLFAEAYAKRAIARAWGYNTGQIDSTHIVKCMDDIIKASELNKDLPEIQIALGFYYYYCKHELDKALEYFSIAYEKTPDDFQPLFYMAMVHRKKAEWRKCMNQIRKLIELDPQDALCLTNIGMTYQYFHNYDSALMFHQKAIDIMPIWPSAYKNMIETLILKNGNTAEARACMDTAVHRTRGNFTEIKIVLDIYDRKYADALQKTEKSHPNDYYNQGDKQLYLAEINHLMNNLKNARLYYDSALVILNNNLIDSRENQIIHGHIGIAYAGIGNKENAIVEGNKAIDLYKYDNFDKSDMAINLAKIYTMIGEYDQAINYIDILLRIPSMFSIELLQLDPIWEPLYNHPKCQLLIKKYLKN
jgi:serine/threonine-protein kinase